MTRLVNKVALVATLGVALACYAVGSNAGNYNFLQNSPLMSFTADDNKMFTENTRTVLESTSANAKSSWSNPKTGNSGEAEVKAQFTSTDGNLCKHLRVFNRSKTAQSEAFYTFCHYQGRGWLVNEDARPKAVTPPAGTNKTNSQ